MAVTPEEFERMMKHICGMTRDDDCPHIRNKQAYFFAVGMVCGLLGYLGYGRGIRIFMDAVKWYDYPVE